MEHNNIYELYDHLLNTLCAETEILRRIPFGKSYLGREIPALQLGEGGGHRILYVGGVTGSLCSAACLLRFVCDFASSMKSGRRIAGIDISYLFHTRTITVVPLLNPDGAVLRVHGTDDKNPLLDRLLSCIRNPLSGRGGDSADAYPADFNPFSGWVTNGRGVDLRCNCDADFTRCMETASGIGQAGFPGMHPESEPECAAVCRYLRGAAETDLVLFLDDEDCDSAFGCVSCPSGDHRTRSIAEILARDMDAARCIAGISEEPGSFAAWYKTRNAGPIVTLSCPGTCPSPDFRGGGFHSGGTQDTCAPCEDPDTASALLYAAAGQEPVPPSADDHPGTTLAQAALALRYGHLRRALFHGTVL